MPGHGNITVLRDCIDPQRTDLGEPSATRSRRRERRVASAAVGIALFTAIMIAVGTWWSFAASVVVTSVAHYLDRRSRVGRGGTGLLMYVLLIYFGSAVVLGVAAAVLGVVLMVLS